MFAWIRAMVDWWARHFHNKGADVEKEIKKTIGVEGGYVNNPADPGGETKFGISKKAYPNVDIAALTFETAAAIYKRDYWDKLFLDSYKYAPFRWKVFDIAVNQGVGTATAFMGLLKKKDSDAAVWELVELQAKRYASLVYKNPKLITFINGWMNRAFERGEDLL